MSKLSIQLVNWNGRSFILNAVKSIVENPPSVDYSIIVVDNDSYDGSVEWLNSSEFRKEIPPGVEMTIIQSNANLGFGKAHNLAFSAVNADFYFVFNPDAIVLNGAIDRLLKTLTSQEDIYCCGPQMYASNQSKLTSVWTGRQNPIRLIADLFMLGKIFPGKFFTNLLHKGSDSPTACPVNIINGAAMMIKRKAIEEYGGFDDDFFMYYEDFEWCERIRKKGKKIYFVPDAKFVHDGGKSTEKVWTNLSRFKVMTESNILYHKKTVDPIMYRLNMLTLGMTHFFLFIIRAIFFKKGNTTFFFRKYFHALIK